MNHRVLGSSGLLVSPICLGTMTFGEPVREKAAIDLVHAAIDLGINFIDTANVYEGYKRYLGSPGGVAESIVGKAVQGKRDDVIIATKVGAPVGPGPQHRGLSATHILRELEHSLKRLQTDYIDLYIVHWPDKFVPLETTMAALDQALKQGKVRAIGASNHNAAQLCEMLWLADKNGWPKMTSSQIPFSLLRREFHSDLAFCKRHSIGVTPYQPLQGGLLTDKYKRGEMPPQSSRASEKPDWIWNLDDPLFDKLERVQSLAAELSAPTAQYALAWTLLQTAMSSVVVGVKSLQQIQEAVDSLGIEIPLTHLEQLDQLLPSPWQQPDPLRG